MASGAVDDPGPPDAVADQGSASTDGPVVPPEALPTGPTSGEPTDSPTGDRLPGALTEPDGLTAAPTTAAPATAAPDNLDIPPTQETVPEGEVAVPQRDPPSAGAPSSVEPEPVPGTGPEVVAGPEPDAPASTPDKISMASDDPSDSGHSDGHHPEDDATGDGDGEDEDDEDEPRKGAGGLLTKDVQISARVLLGVGGVIVLAALVLGAYLLGQRQGDKLLPPEATKTTGTTVFKVPVDYTTFVDAETGVKLSYPKEWTQRSTADLPEKSLRLLAGIPNTADSVSVRVNAYTSEITAANLNDQKNVFDGVIGDDNRKVLVNQTLDLRGLPALFYVYSFTDASTGQSGIHAHFFVFQGRKLVSMVFQAVPEARYALLAPVFDKIANSLEVAPGAPPAFLEPIDSAPATGPGASTTTAPGGTAAPTSAPSTPTSAPSNPTSAPPITP